MGVIMNRSVFATLVCVVGLVGSGVAQTKQPAQAAATKAAPTTGTPAAPAKFVSPVKGAATIDVFAPPAHKIGNDMVTTMKIKNTSAGPIALLKVEVYWYDKKPKPEIVTGDTAVWKKPFQPGEIIEVTLKSPMKPGVELYASKYQFTHANGSIKPTSVKKL
jgi:hypothetical protein